MCKRDPRNPWKLIAHEQQWFQIGQYQYFFLQKMTVFVIFKYIKCSLTQSTFASEMKAQVSFFDRLLSVVRVSNHMDANFSIFSIFTLLKCKLCLHIILWLVIKSFTHFFLFLHLYTWPFYLKKIINIFMCYMVSFWNKIP